MFMAIMFKYHILVNNLRRHNQIKTQEAFRISSLMLHATFIEQGNRKHLQLVNRRHFETPYSQFRQLRNLH